MLVDINFQSDQQTATLSYVLENLEDKRSKQECLAILATFAADFYLDPELEIKDLEEYISQAKEKDKNILTFILHEEGLELEFN